MNSSFDPQSSKNTAFRNNAKRNSNILNSIYEKNFEMKEIAEEPQRQNETP